VNEIGQTCRHILKSGPTIVGRYSHDLVKRHKQPRLAREGVTGATALAKPDSNAINPETGLPLNINFAALLEEDDVGDCLTPTGDPSE
jgi:hypothetical protein